ncbi:aspartic peptidase domain-containing protein [Mucor mucedo]|uniref:aspartic peptidase domain-containing protein n=1 Tax=Mucor mucedo TaxID=29922 RepID=UPI0022202DC1|nr:aspartic peptidase domain-containing protein [Mucor mucedo]KAI7897322.1 aspartic peptidase domain-containing protein [Mucor mucedo]
MYISRAVVFISVLIFTVNAQTIRLPISRQRRADPMISAIQKRNAGLTKRDPFLASLYNDQGSQYLVEVSVGTPAQTFAVTLDTGSADLWIPGSSCPTSECPNGVFNEASSSTFKNLNKLFTLTYGIGSVNGTYVTDSVSISGGTVQNQQFGLASDTKQILTNPNTISASQIANTSNKNIKQLAATKDTSPKANGILGLGFPKLTAASSKGQGVYNPFVFNLAQQNLIADPIFSIYTNSASKTGWVGEIIFGGVDESKYTGNITYMPVVSLSSTKTSSSTNKKRALDVISGSNYYWMVNGQGVSVQDSEDSSRNLDLKFSSPGAFILDTGTTLTYLPTAMAQQVLVAAVGANGYTTDTSSGTYLVDCQAVSTTTQFVLDMSVSSAADAAPITLSVPMSQLFIPLDSTSIETATQCLFGIAPSDSVGVGSNMYLIGDSVLRSAYMVFDMANNRVGIATAVGATGSSVDGVSAPLDSSALKATPSLYLTVVLLLAVFTL